MSYHMSARLWLEKHRVPEREGGREGEREGRLQKAKPCGNSALFLSASKCLLPCMYLCRVLLRGISKFCFLPHAKSREHS